jgi:syntaxin-binding protein 1
MSVCVTLGEYPTIRYYRPLNPLRTHEAHVLSSYIASEVQKEIDMYAQWNRDFMPSESKPTGALFILDRSMDLYAPFLHDFTYQAMAHDLLPIHDGKKITYKTVINEGRPNEEIKDLEINDKDKVWVRYRHLHMTDTIEQIKIDFQKFLDQNPHFAAQSDTTNINDIKDMLAGMPQFQEQKEAYTLNLNMVGDCMKLFEQQKLPDLAVLEQVPINKMI